MGDSRPEKAISSVLRVNPACGFVQGTVVTALEFQEATLYPPVSPGKGEKKGHHDHQHHHHNHHGSEPPSKKMFPFDAVLDDLQKPEPKEGQSKKSKKAKKPIFCTQEEMWAKFEPQMKRRIQDGGADIGTIAFGIPGSGKTHTLFGGSSYSQRGILPRFFEKGFGAKGWEGAKKGTSIKFSVALISAVLLIGEHTVDLFRVNNPIVMHTSQENYVYSECLGPLLQPAQFVCADSAGESKGFLSLALKAAALVLAGHTEVYSSASLHVRVLMVSEDKELYKFSFIEAPSCATPKDVPVNIDRLSGTSQLYLAARSVYDDIPELASNSIDSLSYTKEVLHEHVKTSALLFLLQDVLFRHPDSILFACVRATEQAFAENMKVCKLVDSLWSNQYDPASDPSLQDSDEAGDGGQDKKGKLGSHEVLPLKELLVALKNEIEVCSDRRQAVETTIAENAAAVAAAVAASKSAAEEDAALAEVRSKTKKKSNVPKDSSAAVTGSDNAQPPSPPTRPKKGASGWREAAKAEKRRDRQDPPYYEYTPPEGALPVDPVEREGGGLSLNSTDKELNTTGAVLGPSKAQLAEEARLTLVRRLLAEKTEKLRGWMTLLQNLLPTDSAAFKAGVKQCKLACNHVPLFRPAFPDAKPPHLVLLEKDKAGDPYDSEEEDRAVCVRAFADEQGLQYFAQVVQEWLSERGVALPQGIPPDSSFEREAKATPQGGLDLSLFSRKGAKAQLYDDDEGDEEAGDGGESNLGSSSIDSNDVDTKKSSTGKNKVSGGAKPSDNEFAQRNTWGRKNIDGTDPYIVPLSPHSGLSDHFAKVQLSPGKVVVVRGTNAPSIGFHRTLVQQYSASPIDNDAIKSQAEYCEALGDLMGEGLLPVEDIYRKAEGEGEGGRGGENAARRKTDGDSIATGTTTNSVEENEEERMAREKTLRERDEQDKKRAVSSMIVHGANIASLHCYFKCENQRSVVVRPNTIVSSNAARQAIGSKGKSIPLVSVNGRIIEDSVPLLDMDVVRIGQRYFLLRVPMRPRKANDPAVEADNLFAMTHWEASLTRAYSPALRQAILESLEARLHINHAHYNRNLSSVLKQEDKTALNKLPTFDVPKEALDAVYNGVASWDRAYLCEVQAMCISINEFCKYMRRDLRVSLSLGETSSKDVKYRRLVHVATPPFDLFTSPAQEDEADKAMKNGSIVMAAQPAEASSLMNTVTATGARVPVQYRLKERDKEASQPQAHTYSAQLVCETDDIASNGKFTWNAEVAIQRLHLLQLMSFSFNSRWCARDASWLNVLYPATLDPSCDAQEDELIGVGYLYLDAFQYLLDVNDVVPLVALDGSKVGHLKVRGRVWIDKIETAPAYLTVDREKSLADFENRMCLMRLYFESLMDLPSMQSSSVYCKFNFFYHSKPYTTLRHGGQSTHPFIHSAIKIEQRITGDFLEYIDRGSLEIEVYGKRKSVGMPTQAALGSAANYTVGEVKGMVEEEEDSSSELGSESEEEEQERKEGGMSEADYMVQTLASKLEKIEDQLSRSKELAQQAITEKKEMERKFAAMKAAQEAEDGPEATGGRKGGRREQVAETAASSACTVA